MHLPANQLCISGVDALLASMILSKFNDKSGMEAISDGSKIWITICGGKTRQDADVLVKVHDILSSCWREFLALSEYGQFD